jgi:hypothetical protein
MTNRFGVLLYRDDMRWAAAEGVSETVIAAVLMLHERSVDEIVPKLSAAEIEQVIKLVARSPRVYAPGTLDVLKQRRALVSPEPAQRSGESNRRKELDRKSGTLVGAALIRGASLRGGSLRAALISGASLRGASLCPY